MIISRKLSEAPEVEEISVMMGTPANKSLLDVTGFGMTFLTKRHRMISVFRLKLNQTIPLLSRLSPVR